MRKSDLNLILAGVGVGLALLVYFFGFNKLNAKTEVMQQANAELRVEVERLQELADNKQQYIDDTANMKVAIDEIIAQFPAQYLPEDDIMYMINTEKAHDVLARTINMQPTTVLDVPVPTSEAVVEEAPAEETVAEDGTIEVEESPTVSPDILLYSTPVSVDVATSYESLKDVVKLVNDDKNRKSIDTIAVSFDSSTGELVTTMAMSFYSLTGTEAEYIAPRVDGVLYGTKDIFNSAQKRAKAQSERAAAIATR